MSSRPPLTGHIIEVHWSCEKVKKLDLSHNHLRALPDTFNDLRRLNTLHVSHNNLQELPPSCSWGCINLVKCRILIGFRGGMRGLNYPHTLNLSLVVGLLCLGTYHPPKPLGYIPSFLSPLVHTILQSPLVTYHPS